MIVRPFSDIHAEFWPTNKITRILETVVPPLATDQETIALIAGDLGLAHQPETWLEILNIFAQQFLAVVYVEGNHFYYHNDFFGRINDLRNHVSIPRNVHFLENQSVEIEGAIFIGATLWTDFQGKDSAKMLNAQQKMNDFRLIKRQNGERLLPEDTVDLFYESRKYIFDTIKNAGGRKTAVVTHHGISPLSINEKFRGDTLNCAFMTDLSKEIIEHCPNLWVHGHMHDSFDYNLGKTRVIGNPYGYRDVEVNKEYVKDLVIGM